MIDNYKHYIKVENFIIIDAWSSAFFPQGDGIELTQETILHTSDYPFNGRQFTPKIIENGFYLYKYENSIVVERSIEDKLSILKAQKKDAINKNTSKLIYQGISHSGSVVRAYDIDQFNIKCLWDMRASLTYPIKVSTVDGGYYSVVDATDMNTLFLAGMTRKLSLQDSGKDLRDDIDACETVAEVAAIIDDRT